MPGISKMRPGRLSKAGAAVPATLATVSRLNLISSLSSLRGPTYDASVRLAAAVAVAGGL